MHGLLPVLFYSACTYYGEREHDVVQTVSHLQSRGLASIKGGLNPLSKLAALLLAFEPAAGFQANRPCRAPKSPVGNTALAMRSQHFVLAMRSQHFGMTAMPDATVLDITSLALPEAEALVPSVTEVVNWAYRGKHVDGDTNAWTGERHLIDGIRTDEDTVRSMINGSREGGPQKEALLIAVAPGESLLQQVVGTIHVSRVKGKLRDEAEIGFFSVDPDMQGEGIGGKLLAAAERHAREIMGVSTTVLWVITLRDDIIQWYERKGYVKVDEFAPFPADANVGMPRRADLEFVRLQKVHE